MRRCSDRPCTGSQDTGQYGLERCPAAGLVAGGGVKGLEEDGLECRRCLAGYWILKSKKLERKGD